MTELHRDVRLQIVQLLSDGNKLEAIRIYREASGLDLAASRDFIEQLNRAVESDSEDLDLLLDGNPSGLNRDSTDQILELLRSGDKIPAIKVYRQATNAGLAEAKSAVEKMAAQNGIPQATGCAGILLLACFMSLCLLALYR